MHLGGFLYQNERYITILQLASCLRASLGVQESFYTLAQARCWRSLQMMLGVELVAIGIEVSNDQKILRIQEGSGQPTHKPALLD